MLSRARTTLALARVLVLTLLALGVTSVVHAQQSVTLAWDANTEPNLNGYVVLYGTTSGVYPNSVDVGNVTTRLINGLTDGTTYYFIVKAYNTSAQYSTESNVVVFTTGGTPPPPPPSPTITSVSPASGPTTGGTAITINGTNFNTGVTVTVGGTAATGVNRVSATQVTANTPAGTAGAKAVTVTNTDATTVTAANAFTYVVTTPPPNPTITSVSPASGPTTGGTVITINGTNFNIGATVKIGTTSATGVTRVSSTQLTATTPAGTSGAKSVNVTNTDATTVTASNAFTYNVVTTPPPTVTVTSVSPTSGPKNGGTTITVTGTNFAVGAKIFVAGVQAGNITRLSSTQVRGTTPAGAPGPRNVSVVNLDNSGAILTNGFTYNGPKAKLLTSSPTVGAMTGGTELHLTGSDITTNTTVLIGGVSAASVTHLDGQSMLAVAPARSAAGLVDVSLVEGGEVQSTLSGAFRYTAPVSPDDTDGDGLPNAWETQWGLNPDSADGADGGDGDPDGDGLTNTAEFNASSHPRGSVKRYFAEGVVNGFFDTRFALANPGATAAKVLLEFLDLDGQTSQHILTLAPRSRSTINAREMTALPGKSFATRIDSDQMIVADRLMRWEATMYGSHAETAISEPSTKWYFAEGATTGWYELFYLLQNPSDQAADVQIRYLRSDGPPVTKSYNLGPRSRFNVHVNEEGSDLDHHEVSAEITSANNVPIIAERSMYFSRGLPYMGGHGSAGVTAPSTQWFLAEGATGDFFTMFVLIGNPSPADAQVTVTYLLSDGPPVQRVYNVPANGRVSINVNGEPGLNSKSLASRYESTQPIIVERTMWWPGSPSQWTEGHNSFGVTATGTKWALAEGEQGGPQNTATYVLVANTSSFEGQAKITLLFEDAAEVSRTITLPANSRVNVPFDGPFGVAAGKRFSTIVETLGTTPAQIVVERAMYSDARGEPWSSGSNAVAAKLP